MYFLTSLVASGLDLDSLENVTTPNLPDATVGGIISTIVGNYLFPIAGFIALGMAVVGGYETMFSYGDPKKVVAGKEKITYGVIGFIVIFASYWFVIIAGRILDIQAIEEIFGA